MTNKLEKAPGGLETLHGTREKKKTDRAKGSLFLTERRGKDYWGHFMNYLSALQKRDGPHLFHMCSSGEALIQLTTSTNK